MTSSDCARVVLAAGGTGGHIFPAQAVASELTKRGHSVYVFTDGRGQNFHDSKLPIDVVTISASQMSGGPLQKITKGFSLCAGTLAAYKKLKAINAHATIGFGGYASVPTMLAAALNGLPTIAHQADAYFGRANRFVSPFVSRIATSFPEVANIKKSWNNKVVFTGLPIRPEIMSYAQSSYKPCSHDEKFSLLVVGGSQGAQFFGELLPEAISLLTPDLQSRLHITQQCRPELLEKVKKRYLKTKAQVELSSFLDNMGERYQNSHLIISRSGASSVIESATVGRPAIFIPYPYAMDDHQTYNAKMISDRGGGWLWKQQDLNAKKLAKQLHELIYSPEQLSLAALKTQEIVVPNAAIKLVEIVEELIRVSKKKRNVS